MIAAVAGDQSPVIRSFSDKLMERGIIVVSEEIGLVSSNSKTAWIGNANGVSEPGQGSDTQAAVHQFI